MQLTIDETNRRRQKQLSCKKEHGIIPNQIIKKSASILDLTGPSRGGIESKATKEYRLQSEQQKVAERSFDYLSKETLEDRISATRKAMEEAARVLDFVSAAQYRDELFELQAMLGDQSKVTAKEAKAQKRLDAVEHQRAAHAKNRSKK